MGPVSAEIEIDVPRQRAFEAIADLSLRPAFTDHFLTDFHLTRIEPTGIGAGARFRIAVRPRRVWMDTTIVEAEAPHRLVEHGRGGRLNRIPSVTLWADDGTDIGRSEHPPSTAASANVMPAA